MSFGGGGAVGADGDDVALDATGAFIVREKVLVLD